MQVLCEFIKYQIATKIYFNQSISEHLLFNILVFHVFLYHIYFFFIGNK